MSVNVKYYILWYIVKYVTFIHNILIQYWENILDRDK